MPPGCPAAVGAATARRQRIKNQERERKLREYIMEEEREKERQEATEKTIARREQLNNEKIHQEKTKKTIKQQNQVKNEKTKQTDCCCVS
jgi:hypothetical protein